MSYPPYTPLPTYPLPIPPLEVGSLAIPGEYLLVNTIYIPNIFWISSWQYGQISLYNLAQHDEFLN